jgi:UDP-N-acetylglucosamine 4,6-dehydratase
VTRNGNVINSRGSVLEVFRKRIAENKPLLVTGTKSTRFWTTGPAAARFTIDALYRMKGGEIFIPRLKSFRVLDLAKAVGEKYEERPARPGDKTNETLISWTESGSAGQYKHGFIITTTETPWSGHFEYQSGENEFLSAEDIKLKIGKL